MRSKSPQKTFAFFTGLILALTALAASAKDSLQNKKNLAALEPLEQLTEDALAGKTAKIDAGLKTVHSGRADTRALLSETAAARFDEAFGQLDAADAKHDNIGVSLQAAELYKVLALALDASALKVPKEVALLDYVSFRINALLAAPDPDWTAIASTAKEANDDWVAVRDRVGNAKLRGEMDDAQQGIAAGSGKHDAALTKANVKKDADIVDDLEKYFSKK